MSGQNRLRNVIALSVALLLLGSDRSSNEKKLLPAATAAAALLGDRFETVFYADAGLLTSTGGYKQLSKQTAAGLRMPFADLLAALESLGPHASAEVLSKAEAILVGAKDFRPPAALGDVQSQFCYVVVLAAEDRSILAGTSKSPGVSEQEGSVWRWAAKPTEGRPSPMWYYATQAGGSYLVITNNLEDLRVAAQTLATSKNGTSPPVSVGIREWETISHHELWGYRNYHYSQPDNREAAGLSQIMPDAQALAFFADPSHRVGVLRLYSAAADTAYKINAKHLLPSLEQVSTGLWEANVSLSGGQTLEQVANVMGLFGFAIYL